jgi:hypothetical protein
MNAADHVHAVPPEELMAYLDGELPSDRATFVASHVAQCGACQAVASDLRQVSSDLSAWRLESPPDRLRAPRAPEAVSRRRSWFAWLMPSASPRFVAVATASVVVVGISLVTFTMRQAALEEVELTGSGGLGPSGSERYRRGGESPTQRPNLGAHVVSPAPQQVVGEGLSSSPKIIRTASLTVVTKDFESVRPAIDRILRDVGGFVGQIQASDSGNARTLQATLRVPASRLDESTRLLRSLGHVVNESQSGDDVTEQVQDIEARLANGRNTERRLTEVLKNRTGKVSDVLEVEREIARVREEIERLDAQRVNLERRVTYATITLQVTEQRQATLDMGPLPVRVQLRNALVDGLRQAYESGIDVVLWVLQVAPVLLLWTALLWWPARILLRAIRARATASG